MSAIISGDPFELISAGQWEQLAAAWPDAERLLAAFRLARDLDTCRDLLAGRPVDRGRLDRRALAWAARRQLVQLRPPLEQFEAPT